MAVLVGLSTMEGGILILSHVLGTPFFLLDCLIQPLYEGLRLVLL